MTANKPVPKKTAKPKRDDAVVKLAKDEISYLSDFIKTEYLLAQSKQAVQNRIIFLEKFV